MKQDKNRESKQVRAGSSTYFIDVETTSKRYLCITESRYPTYYLGIAVSAAVGVVSVKR